MSAELAFIVAGSVLLGIVIGIAFEKWDKNRVALAMAQKIGQSVSPALSSAEQELVALWRKHTTKNAPAAPAPVVPPTPPSASTAANPTV